VSRIPAPLAALLAVALILATTWSLVTPAFQAPDEQAHVAYALSLAERGTLPGQEGRLFLSTEQSLAAGAANSDQTAGVLLTRPSWARATQERWEATAAGLPAGAREDGGGPNPAAPNPPLSYLLNAGAATVAGDGFFDRLWAMRLMSVLAFLGTVLGTWLLCGEVFGRRRVLQVASAGSVALAPMLGFLGGAVMPDPLVIALSSLALWLGARIIRRGITVRDALALGLVIGAAAAAKAAALVLLPPAAFALAVGAWRTRRAGAPGSGGVLVPLVAAAGGVAATFGVWVVISRIIDRAATGQVAGTATGVAINVRELGSYLWQFYLPRFSFQTPFERANDTLPVFQYWVKGTWADFGWLEVHFGDPVYALLAVVMAVIAVLGVRTLVRMRASVDLWLLAFFALAVLTLLAGVHWTEYRQYRSGIGAFVQGRYALPLAALAGLLVALALRGLAPRTRAIAGAVLLGGLFTLNLFAFGLVLERFYA
jgi:4-amino-4-deoxy-L-arabinose transferase-like glycosyltransferase